MLHYLFRRLTQALDSVQQIGSYYQQQLVERLLAESKKLLDREHPKLVLQVASWMIFAAAPKKRQYSVMNQPRLLELVSFV
jgi:hypothetical protein